MINRRSHLKQLLAATALPGALAVPSRAWAAAYPERPVRLVVPLSAGGGVDILARLIADQLAQRMKQGFMVDNRPGGAGNIGTELVVRSPGDGYTLLFVGNSITLNSHLFNLRFDPRTDLVPVSHTVNTYQILLAHPSTGFNTVQDLIAAAKARPGQIAYGSAGAGTPGHVAGVVFEKMAGVKLNHIPYKGAGPAINDLMGGQLQIMFASLPSALPHVESGRLKALGISSPRPSALAPRIPTIAASLPGYEQVTWFGLLAPKGTPVAIQEQIAREVREIVQLPQMKQKLAEAGMEPVGDGPARFGRMFNAEYDAWRDFVKETPIKAD